jgi:hypothetical protein
VCVWWVCGVCVYVDNVCVVVSDAKLAGIPLVGNIIIYIYYLLAGYLRVVHNRLIIVTINNRVNRL